MSVSSSPLQPAAITHVSIHTHRLPLLISPGFQLVHDLAVHDDWVRQCPMDGDKLVSAGQDSKLVVTNPRTGASVARDIPELSGIFALRYAGGGNLPVESPRPFLFGDGVRSCVCVRVRAGVCV